MLLTPYSELIVELIDLSQFERALELIDDLERVYFGNSLHEDELEEYRSLIKELSDLSDNK